MIDPGTIANIIESYWVIANVTGYALTRLKLSKKSKEEVGEMKRFRDSSALKKILYLSYPTIYIAIKDKRKKMEKEEQKTIRDDLDFGFCV
jgi:hypothetical protein